MSRNVTKIVARFTAGSLNVCRVGSTVALHLNTPEGEVVVTMRERDFIQGARGPVDHNGNPFRSADQIDCEKRLLVEALDTTKPL